jgi:hypothetical protein
MKREVSIWFGNNDGTGEWRKVYTRIELTGQTVKKLRKLLKELPGDDEIYISAEDDNVYLVTCQIETRQYTPEQLLEQEREAAQRWLGGSGWPWQRPARR